MRPIRLLAGTGLAVLVSACGGGDGPTPPPNPTVASVVITAPAAAPTFGALGRTVQFAAEARDGQGAAVSGVGITWNSSNQAAATVSASGLVTAVGNGATTISASGSGKTSAGVTVTVSQVAVLAVMSPSSPTLGALGSQRQMSFTLRDSTGNTLPGTPPAATWSVSNGGTISVSTSGLVTALAVSTPGAADSVLATVTVGSGNLIAATAVIVTQVPANLAVTAPPGDTVLRTTGRTRQFTATARDSGGNLLATQPTFIWAVTGSGAVTVNGSGLVTAVTDGVSNVTATVGNVSAGRTQVVQRYGATFTLAPGSATITTNGGTQGFTATVQDSNAAALPAAWLSRSPSVATVSPASGAATTATAVANGSTFIVMSGGMRTDSASLVVSGQSGVTSIAVNVGDNFFRSMRNNTQNPARDTISAGGTVTWTWVGVNPHSVRSTGSPSFTSSPTQSSGTYQIVFNTLGTYSYDCAVHGAAMSGTVVVQ